MAHSLFLALAPDRIASSPIVFLPPWSKFPANLHQIHPPLHLAETLLSVVLLGRCSPQRQDLHSPSGFYEYLASDLCCDPP